MAFICVSVSGESVPSSAMETDSNTTEKIEDGVTRSWDEKINEMIGPATQSIESVVFWSIEIGEHSVPFVLVWLVLGAAVFTVYFKFINIRGFKLATDIVRGKYTNPKEQGEVSHFQALTAALSGTVGLGNIAGVAVAISLGGPGATFWMIVAGLLGMSAKFVECTLGVKYRQIDDAGKTYGGPMYYLSQVFAKGACWVGQSAGCVFAIMCITGPGRRQHVPDQPSLPAVRRSHGRRIHQLVDGEGLVIRPYFLLLSLALSSSGASEALPNNGEDRAIHVWDLRRGGDSDPDTHFTQIPTALPILRGAFSGEAIAGGVIGVMIQGFKRAAFSNEAGIGSASIAHSAVRTENPASEGLVSLLEPFIDTVVVCTMTALVIIITDKEGQPITPKESLSPPTPSKA